MCDKEIFNIIIERNTCMQYAFFLLKLTTKTIDSRYSNVSHFLKEQHRSHVKKVSLENLKP
jgi:hypothetical protein